MGCGFLGEYDDKKRTVLRTVRFFKSYSRSFRQQKFFRCLHHSLQCIPAFCFVSCGKLSQMTLSKNVKKIGANIINYCTQLKTITYEGSLEEWKEVEKYANWDGNSGSTNPGYLDNIVCIDGTMVYDRDNKTWNEVKS